MDWQSSSVTPRASADESLYPTDSNALYEESCFDRLCYMLCCRSEAIWGHSSSYGSMTRPPGLTDSSKRPSLSDGTMFGVRSLSQDSESASVSQEPQRLSPQAKAKFEMLLKGAGRSRAEQITEPTAEPQPCTSTSTGQLTQCDLRSEFSEELAPKSDHPESTNPNTDISMGTDTATSQNFSRVMVDFWNHTKRLRLPVRRGFHHSLTKLFKKSPPMSSNPELPFVPPKSDEVIVDSSGPSRAVYKKYGRTGDEAGPLLTGEEGTGEQNLGISLSTPIKSSLSTSKLDVIPKSRESLSSTGESISAEKTVRQGGYLLLSECTDATISEKSSSSSADKLELTSKLTQSASTTQQSTSAEKMAWAVGYLPLSEASTGTPSENPIFSPAKSHSTGDELDFISKSIESFPSTQESTGAEKVLSAGGYLPFTIESPDVQKLKRSMSVRTRSSSSGVDLVSSSKSTDSLTILQLTKAGFSGHLELVGEKTGAETVSSGIESNLSSKSTESLSTSEQCTEAEKTAGGGICQPFLKATSEQIVQTATPTSSESFSSRDKLDFTVKSTESLPTPKQSTDGEEKAELEERPELTESSSQAVTSSHSEKLI